MEQKAYEILKKFNIDYKRFDHEPVTTLKGHLKMVEGPQVKNIVLRDKKAKNIYFIMIEESKEVNIDNLKILLEENRLSFLSEDKLKEILMCEKGTVTPLGLYFDTEHRVKVIIDDELNVNETIGLHPFVNTTTLNVLLKDLITFFDILNIEYKFIKL